MKTIISGEVLDYYDGPLVFEAADAAGSRYVAAALHPERGPDRYAVVAVRPERLREFREGRLDLRTLMLEAPGGEWHIASSNGVAGETLMLERQAGLIGEAGWALPLPGYTLEPLGEGAEG